MSTGEPTIDDLLAQHGLGEHAPRLTPFARPELALVAADAGAAAGRTRIGGAPELPDSFAWPCHRWPLAEVATWPDFAQRDVAAARAQGQVHDDGDALVMPLPFLAQIDLEAIAPLDPRLPPRGLLVFFASITTDIADPRYAKRVAAAVAHVDGALTPRPPPPTTDEPPAEAVALAARWAPAWDIPFEELQQLQAQLPPPAYARLIAERPHALFPGPALECVGPMPPDGEVALLRLHEDDVAGWRVGDASWLTFVLDLDDLRAHRFDRVRASVYIG